MSFPEDYPFNPPTFRFNRDFYHPNGTFAFSCCYVTLLLCYMSLCVYMIWDCSRLWCYLVYPDGRLCISILHPPGDDPVSGEKAEVSIVRAWLHRIGVIEQGRFALGTMESNTGKKRDSEIRECKALLIHIQTSMPWLLFGISLSKVSIKSV